MLKVIGGEFRGRNLYSVPGEDTRPPLARVRAAVANVLVEYIDDARILDLFAGTGSYSIELLSRGASFATCIDKSPKAVEIIRKNVSSLGLTGRLRVICGDSIRLIGTMDNGMENYRIVIVAPPYFAGLDKAAMDLLGKSRLVEPAGIVVLQQHKKEPHAEAYGNLRLRKTYAYGETKISTYLVSQQVQ
ncbi:MAG TPA: 16S rRNA (guanine(966)-N(2))-methyltransferase RsmD [Firmicutes bacterium]|nr:16S rRNA (guanine(966)-N(2))-methyltransferase RsmD [Candidatus Fermentithermobacillaceae bacterium]